MSLFQSTQILCPLCKTSFDFEAVHSVNADRRPDLRDAILLNEFQRLGCPRCGERFRLAPSFNYLDVAHDLWIVAAPVTGVADWEEREAAARGLFSRSYGKNAPEAAPQLLAAVSARPQGARRRDPPSRSDIDRLLDHP